MLATAGRRRGAASTAELRVRQRTGSRVFGVVFKIGDLIANRYRVKDIVGSGGAGVVYRAHDQEIDVDVAVKVINAKLVQTSDEQRLFSRQTKIARKLSHQNVVRIYDEGRDEQRPYVTMQFLEGLSLRKIIDLRREKKQVFALAEVEPIFNQLCQALDYAHKTTFHGDLKPDNVIVLPDLLKITDFALLRGLPRKPFLAIQKSRGSNFGYLAPEVRLEVADIEKSVDTYSLGVILAEMLTGVVYDDTKPEQLSMGSTTLDPAILAVVKRCVSRSPRERYGSTVELYKELRAALNKGGAARAKAPTPPPAPAAEPNEDGPTQRLNVDEHGDRPVKQDDAKRPEEDKPKAVEVQPNIAVASAVVSPAKPAGEEHIDIDDEMIESSIENAPALSPTNGTNGKSGQAVPAPLPDVKPAKAVAAPEDEDLVDNPHAVELPEDEEETIAVFDHPPMPPKRPEPVAPSMAAAGAGAGAGGESAIVDAPLEEISNSAIELIADPSATNVYDVDGDGVPKPSVEVKVDNRTIQPTPLPDSAIPAPAFSNVAQENTRHGELAGDIPDDDTKNERPNVHAPPVSRPTGKPDANDEPTQGIPYSPRPVAREPTEALPRPKKRPMTRPRMPVAAPAPIPQTSTLGGPSVVADPSLQPARPQTMPPEALSIPSMVSPPITQTQLPPPPPPEPRGQKSVVITLALSVVAVLAALVIVVVVMTRQNDQVAVLQKQIAALQAESQTADKKSAAASEEAKRAGEEAAKAAKAEEEAKAAAAKLEAERKAAEEEAKRQEEEARRLEAEAKKEADAKRAAEAKKRAEEASAAAKERRAAAADAAERRKAERARAEKQRERREAREAEREAKERQAREEAEAARRARERARRLADAKEADAAKAKAAADEERRRREAEAAAREREEERKRREEEAAAKKKKEAEDKKLAAVAPAADKEKCPRGMVLVKAGSFMLGSKGNDPERNFGDLNYTSTDVGAYCIDYYEYPNGRGRSPTTKVSYKTAAARCKRRGKRLCSEEEWEKACKGPSGSRYPYANSWNPSACNTEDDEGTDREIEKSGTFRKCRSGYNVYDMSGNVAEWTSTKKGSGYIVKGGAADRPGYDGRCAARKKKKSGTSSETLGFRCCADPG